MTFLPLQYEICIICPVGLHIISNHLQTGDSRLHGQQKNKKRVRRNAGADAGTYAPTTKSGQPGQPTSAGTKSEGRGVY